MRFIVGERVFLDAASRASWDVVDRCRATNDEAQDPCRDEFVDSNVSSTAAAKSSSANTAVCQSGKKRLEYLDPKERAWQQEGDLLRYTTHWRTTSW
jgi:hypothetical protein